MKTIIYVYFLVNNIFYYIMLYNFIILCYFLLYYVQRGSCSSAIISGNAGLLHRTMYIGFLFVRCWRAQRRDLPGYCPEL